MTLVDLYKRHIYVINDEEQQALDELESIAVAIVNKRYDDIITNSSELIQPTHPNSFPKTDYPF